MSLSRLFTYSPAAIELYFAGLSAETQLEIGCKNVYVEFIFRSVGRDAYLDVHMVICTEKQRDGVAFLAALVCGSVNGGLEDIVCRTKGFNIHRLLTRKTGAALTCPHCKLVTDAKMDVVNTYARSEGYSSLDDQCVFDRGCIDPPFLRVHDLKGLDFRLLPENGKTLKVNIGSISFIVISHFVDALTSKLRKK